MAYHGVNPFPFQGLSRREIQQSRKTHGVNEVQVSRHGGFLSRVRAIVTEPMVVILIAVAAIYMLLGEYGDAVFMIVSLAIILAISLYQDSRSDRALAALRERNEPWVTVIRANQLHRIASRELVVGDLVIAEEGGVLPADGTIIHSHDFSVDESALTGESLPVVKDVAGNVQAWSGTCPLSGLAVVKVTTIGEQTAFGQIERSLALINQQKTPLQRQLRRFVLQMSLVGGAVFVLILAVAWSRTHQLMQSLLNGLTLAMSIIPEEIPVAFSVFMALGAWRLMQKKVIVKDTRVVEALGAATVVCADKTGTITENRMTLAGLFVTGLPVAAPGGAPVDASFMPLLSTAMWASERVPFDPMETSLHEAYTQSAATDERPAFRIVHEYPLAGTPPMMTHVFEDANGKRIIAAKGAPEAILPLVPLSTAERAATENALAELSAKGYRVLAVAASPFAGADFPKDQRDLPFGFSGLVAFYDPPKAHIKAVFQRFANAGVDVKMITGDNAATALNIARLAGLPNNGNVLTGEQVARLNDDELKAALADIDIFARMFPDAKLRIIRVLKEMGHVVAMTGDGVNDAPALKLADIGIAMGRRGTEVARRSAALILLDDSLDHLVDAIAAGRRIYANLKKTVHYVIGIHLPIILAVLVPLLFGWKYPALFTPMHVIFFELVMGSTCAIVYENEPLDAHAMNRPPRKVARSFFSARELSAGLLQGGLIAAGSLALGNYFLHSGASLAVVTSVVFSTQFPANLAFTISNASAGPGLKSALRNRSLVLVAVVSAVAGITLFALPATRLLFNFALLSPAAYAVCAVTGIACGIGGRPLANLLRRRPLRRADSVQRHGFR